MRIFLPLWIVSGSEDGVAVLWEGGLEAWRDGENVSDEVYLEFIDVLIYQMVQ